MKAEKIWKYASLLTAPSALLIGFHLFLLIFTYKALSSGEGWGVVYVIGALFWLSVVLFFGILIRKFIKSTRLKLTIESATFLFLALYVWVNF